MTPDEYQVLCAAVLRDFAAGKSIVEGSRPQGDPAEEQAWRVIVHRLTCEHPEVILSGACWRDLSNPGEPLLRWHWVKKKEPSETRIFKMSEP